MALTETLPYRRLSEAVEEISLMDSPYELRSLFDATKREGRTLQTALEWWRLDGPSIRRWLFSRRATKRLRLLGAICEAIADRTDLLVSEPPFPEAAP